MKKLFRFHCDIGRHGELRGTFVLDDKEQAKLETLYGKRIHFGDALGKHSDVKVDLEREEITMMTDDQEFLAMAEKLGVDLNQGHNPLDYYVEEEEEDEG